MSALFKGLPLDLMTVAPARAVYFGTYGVSKRILNESGLLAKNSTPVHLLSAAHAGFAIVTLGSPIWLVETRLQLHHGHISIADCIRRIYAENGVRGFYRGMSASYVGISETCFRFVIYERLRNAIDIKLPGTAKDDVSRKFINYLIAGGVSKLMSSFIGYPNDVIRTRLREEKSLSKKYLPTLKRIYRQEGLRAFYRGLKLMLIRSVPNTAITMGTYELILHLLHGASTPQDSEAIDQECEEEALMVA